MSQLPTTGAYVLLISVQAPISLCIGKLGKMDFRPGWYVYIGSAMGHASTSLHHRLRRHFAPVNQKRMHWHVDYLLASPQSNLAGAVIIPSSKKVECEIVSLLQGTGIQSWGSRFGASDCSTCPSHLLFLNSLDAALSPTQILIQLQKEIGLGGFTAELTTGFLYG
jgi:Uri superfamily endonuclease